MITYFMIAILFGLYIFNEIIKYFYQNEYFDIGDKILYFIAIIIFSISVGILFK